MTVWQIGAGDWGRDYSQLCIDHDVMIMGPGATGDFRRDDSDYTSLSGQRRGAIRSFCYDAEPGDIVLLRRGHRVAAIGIIAENRYAWDRRFDDVYGWDLQHSQRVCWQDQLSQQLDALQVSEGLFSSRKQIPTFTRVGDDRVLKPIEPLMSQCQVRDFKPLPSEPDPELSPEKLGEGLFSLGLSQGSVESLLGAIHRQCRLLKWYAEHGRASVRPTEHEVVAYMVLPMLLALGWSEQLLAVEWNKVDLAAFRRTPTTAEGCVLLCEAKGMWDGLQGALGQAENYAEKLGLRACEKIVLTQGGRFYVYVRDASGGWRSDPVGYVNVEKLRSRYVVPPDTNAIDTLMSLTPQQVFGRSS